MMWELLRYLRNFFPLEAHEGDFEIVDGKLSGADEYLKVGQWFLISDSIFNDGVYQYGSETLTDESWTGTVTPLRIPREVVQLQEDISAWRAENDSKTESPFNSESFGGYSYTRATGSDGNAAGWQGAFASRLKVWRSI